MLTEDQIKRMQFKIDTAPSEYRKPLKSILGIMVERDRCPPKKKPISARRSSFQDSRPKPKQRPEPPPPKPWTANQRLELTDMLALMANTQKTYGKEINVELVLSLWQQNLEGRFFFEKVRDALNEYMCYNNDFPTLADINKILDPTPSKSEYEAAVAWEKRNGYDEFSDARRTINNYRLPSNGPETTYHNTSILHSEDDRKLLWYEND